MPLCAPVHWAGARSDRETNFGVTGECRAERVAVVVECERDIRALAARTAFSLISSGFQSLLATERCLLLRRRR